MAKTPTVKSEKHLQTACVNFAKRCIEGPHLVIAFDRSQAQTPEQHMWEKARGILAGCPDTAILIPGKSVWIELKRPGGKLSEQQRIVGEQLIAAGHSWQWTDSVTGYWKCLQTAGVPMQRSAEIMAMDFDARLAAKAMASPTPTRTRQPRAEKPSVAQVRRAEAFRAKLFRP